MTPVTLTIGTTSVHPSDDCDFRRSDGARSVDSTPIHSEETISRGYLMLRFRPILRSTILAVLLAAFIFALGHGYEGTAGALTVGAMGVVFSAVYLWRRSLVAPATMHFLLDAVAIIVVPFLT